MKENELRLTRFERISLINQNMILEKLSKLILNLEKEGHSEEIEEFKNRQEILRAGIVNSYSMLEEELGNEIGAEVFNEVMDILNMFKTLDAKVREIKDDELNKELRTRGFSGFDVIAEPSHYSVAKLYIINLELFKELSLGPRLDSCPSLDSYRAQLKEFNKLKSDLTKASISRILRAVFQ